MWMAVHYNVHVRYAADSCTNTSASNSVKQMKVIEDSIKGQGPGRAGSERRSDIVICTLHPSCDNYDTLMLH